MYPTTICCKAVTVSVPVVVVDYGVCKLSLSSLVSIDHSLGPLPHELADFEVLVHHSPCMIEPSASAFDNDVNCLM